MFSSSRDKICELECDPELIALPPLLRGLPPSLYLRYITSQGAASLPHDKMSYGSTIMLSLGLVDLLLLFLLTLSFWAKLFFTSSAIEPSTTISPFFQVVFFFTIYCYYCILFNVLFQVSLLLACHQPASHSFWLSFCRGTYQSFGSISTIFLVFLLKIYTG